MISAIRELDIGWELGMYALTAGCILVVALVIVGLIVLIRFFFRSSRHSRRDAL